MNPQAQQTLLPLLRPHEHLLWSGMPGQGFLLKPSDATLIPFSLVWSGIAIHWEYYAIEQGTPLFFRLWGVPFILFGIYDRWLRQETYYGVTESRIIIQSGIFNVSTDSLDLANLPEIILTRRGDGRGTISFGRDKQVGRSTVRAPASK